jgi:hypothetical protein
LWNLISLAIEKRAGLGALYPNAALIAIALRRHARGESTT